MLSGKKKVMRDLLAAIIYTDSKMTYKTIIRYFQQNPLMILIIAIPLAFIAKMADGARSGYLSYLRLPLVPMAGLIGQATESLAVLPVPRLAVY